MDLYEADFDPAWLRWAEELAQALLASFHDPVDGGFHSTLAGATDLLHRLKPGFDQAVPSANTLAARALLRLSRHLRREDFRQAAEGTLRCFGPWLGRAPQAFLGLLGVLDTVLRDPLEVAISGDVADPRVGGLLREVRRRHLPGRVVSVSSREDLPLHQGRQRPGGSPQAFVCRGRTCAAPVAAAAQLAALLEASPALG